MVGRFALVFLLTAAPAAAADRFLTELQRSAKKTAMELAPSLSGKVCVLDIADAADRDQTSELGQKYSELLATELVRLKDPRFTVVARQELRRIARDILLLTGDDTEIIESLQKNANADIILSGTYSKAGDEISFSLRAVTASKGAVVGAASVSLDSNEVADRMLSRTMRLDAEPAEPEQAVKETPTTLEPAPAAPVPAEPEVLNLDVGVFYEGADGKLYPIREGMVLTSKDNYAIYVRPEAPCHVYIYQVDGTRKATRLFPNSEYSFLKNPLPVKDLWIPDENGYLFLDEQRGREEVYVFATKEKARFLEDISDLRLETIETAIRKMGVAGRRGTLAQGRLRGTHNDSSDLLLRRLTAKGDFFYRLSFIHK